MLATPTRPTIKLPPFHPRQREIARDETRFRVAACGRRFGKTRLGAALCMMTAGTGGRAWWVAPSYPVALVGWRLIKRLSVQYPGAEVRVSERLIALPNGGEIQVRSADNPDSLRGEGLDFLVMDECAFIQEEAWQEALRPALSDRIGRALFISTPKGQNWFYDLWLRCVDPTQDEWRGWQLPTADNPYIAAAEIEAARLSLPERAFAQEYLAEFLVAAGGQTFHRDWWPDANRYYPDDYRGRIVARFQSWDTAETNTATSAWTVGITGDITDDYRLLIRDVYRARLTFDVLPQTIESVARQHNGDGRLQWIVIEDKSSGKAANQTLKATSPDWLRDKISPYQPTGSKEQRAGAASVWCRNGMVLLPHPGPTAPWLLDFEDELMSFPQSTYADQVDSFSQLILFCENYLAAGYAALAGRTI